MTIQQFRKLKIPIEKLVKQITDYSTEKGVDISSPQFELTIERAISNFLGEQGFKYDEYIARKTEDNSVKSAIDEGLVVNNAEMVSFIKTTDGLIKDLKQTKEEAVKVVNQTVSQAKQFVESLDREPIKWDRVTNKPKIITDKEVKGMIDQSISEIPEGEKTREGNKIFYEKTFKKDLPEAEKGDIMIVEDTGETYIYE
jgi:pyruvate-formate lyase-activating enzyme